MLFFCSKQPDLRRGHFLQQPALLYSLFLNQGLLRYLYAQIPPLISHAAFSSTAGCSSPARCPLSILSQASEPGRSRWSRQAPGESRIPPWRQACNFHLRWQARSTHVGGSADPFPQLNCGSFLTPASGSKLLSAGLRRSCLHDTGACRRRLAS